MKKLLLLTNVACICFLVASCQNSEQPKTEITNEIKPIIKDSVIATDTTKDRLKAMPSLFTPVPSWTPLENGKSYDLSILENENSLQSRDTYSIGTLAISLLISEVGAKKVFDFMSVVGFPRQWKDVFLESFGFSAEDFYKRFSDYHSWYFYQNGFQTIQSTNYLPIASKKVSPKTINCANGKTTKKVSGTNPKCPKGYKVKV